MAKAFNRSSRVGHELQKELINTLTCYKQGFNLAYSHFKENRYGKSI
jgi:hypothetical protein